MAAEAETDSTFAVGFSRRRDTLAPSVGWSCTGGKRRVLLFPTQAFHETHKRPTADWSHVHTGWDEDNATTRHNADDVASRTKHKWKKIKQI